MSEPQKRHLWILGALVIATAILLPVVFGVPRGISGQAGDGWRNFVYDFQTLISGVTAVLAAAYTVRQMIRSDAKQDRRHKEAMAFAMRGETRRMHRGLHPQLADLRNAQENMDAAWIYYEDYAKQNHREYRWFSDLAIPVIPIMNEVVSILERSTIVDATEIFDGDLLLLYERTLQDARDISRWLSRHVEVENFTDVRSSNEYFFYENVEWDDAGLYRVAVTGTFPVRLHMLIKQMDAAARELDRMRTRFEIG